VVNWEHDTHCYKRQGAGGHGGGRDHGQQSPLPFVASFPDVQIAAICDIDEKRLHDTAAKYGVEKRYIDYRQMIEERLPMPST